VHISCSFLVFAGLVFAALSQPYMQHQYGKDWARKAPIRLCDRVLYGILEQPDQEVVILSQVSYCITTIYFRIGARADWLTMRAI
jgi:hypothetical protein